MEWEFTAEEVVKAEVGYGLADFRRDLGEEVRMNLGGADEVPEQQTFDLVYDLCYALATNRRLDDFLAAYAFDPPTCEFLREIRTMMDTNAEMLGAILQRMIMDGVEKDVPLEQALGAAAARHGEVV